MCMCVFKLDLVHPQDVGPYNKLGHGPFDLLLVLEQPSSPGGAVLRDTQRLPLLQKSEEGHWDFVSS